MADNPIPKGAGQMETPPEGKTMNQPGVYEHPVTKKQSIVMPDGQSTGVADAVVRMGFKKVAEAPSRVELLKMQEAQARKDAAAEKAGKTTGVNTEEAPAIPVNGTVTAPVVSPEDHAAALERAEAAEKALAELTAVKEVPVPAAPKKAPAAPKKPQEDKKVPEQSEEKVAEAPVAPADPTPEAPADEEKTKESEGK